MQHSTYLESKVLTAPPQRLHLMLLEGALRFGRQAEEALQRGDQTGAAGPLLRVIDIVGELLAGVRQGKLDVNKKLADLYWFLFRRVTEAKIHADAAALAEALRLLEYERETWQLVCEKNSATGVPSPTRAFLAPDGARSGLSLEA
jgi:flagellar protein FliS